jgi:hypothetical protein
MIHEMRCPLNGTETPHTDAAKRVSDTFRLHRLADPIGNTGRWFAASLADGSSDGTLYDTRRDAVTHQHHNEQNYTFIQIIPADMNPCQAESHMGAIRKLHDAGISLVDRDHRAGGRSLIPRVAAEDQRAQVAAILSGGKLPQRNIRQ